MKINAILCGEEKVTMMYGGINIVTLAGRLGHADKQHA